MTEREAFIEAIAACPDEDTPRLAFADWLQEEGEDDRAALVRLACDIAARRRAMVYPTWPLPDDLKDLLKQACDRFDLCRSSWLGEFYHALGCEETPLVERPPGWAGRLWGHVVGDPRVARHHVEHFGGDGGVVRVEGNGPVSELGLQRGFVERLSINFGSAFAVRDLDAAFRLEPVHRLSFRFDANPELWRSVDVAGLSRVASLNLQLPGAHSRRYSAAFAELAFGGNWSGLRDLHVWCPAADGMLIPRGYVHPLANAPLLSGLHSLGVTVAAADLPLLTNSAHARNLRKFRVWGSHLPPDAADDVRSASFRPNLESLDLSLNDLGDSGARRLASGVWPKLRRLDLGANDITDAGVQSLLPLVPQLTELSLASGQITDAGARALTDALDADAIESLCLSYNPLSSAMARALSERFGSRFYFLNYDNEME